MNLAEKILASVDIKTELVSCPEWGVDLYVRGMTGKERDRFEEECLVKKGKKKELSLSNIRARLVAFCTVDGDGKRVFSDSQVEALGEKSAKPIDRLFSKAQELSGLTDEDAETLAKN